MNGFYVAGIAPAPRDAAVHISRPVLSDTPFLFISSGMLLQFIPACNEQHQGTINGSFQFSPSLKKLILQVRQMLGVLGLLGSTFFDFSINFPIQLLV